MLKVHCLQFIAYRLVLKIRYFSYLLILLRILFTDFESLELRVAPSGGSQVDLRQLFDMIDTDGSGAARGSWQVPRAGAGEAGGHRSTVINRVLFSDGQIGQIAWSDSCQA